MAVESGSDAGLLALLNQGNRNNDGMFGGGAGGVLTGMLFGRLLSGNNGFGDNGCRPLQANDVQNIVNDAIAGSTANSNAMLLLKDIQDSSQGTDSLISESIAGVNQNVLQGQIASLQASSNIMAAIESSKSSVINEIHESSDSLNHAVTTVNRDVLISRYELDKAITNDGDKTRNAIAHLAASIPNSRELDLQRQLTVALDNERHRDLQGRIEQGNVTVTTNVNQAQAQAQMQVQLQAITHELGCLRTHQQATANNLNILGTQRGVNQTPVNVNQ